MTSFDEFVRRAVAAAWGNAGSFMAGMREMHRVERERRGWPLMIVMKPW